jgi:hypothetical protein
MFSKEFQIGKGKGSHWHGKIQVIGPTTTFRCLRLSRPGWPRSRTSKRATNVLVRTQVTGQAGPLSSDVCVYVRVRVSVCWLCPNGNTCAHHVCFHCLTSPSCLRSDEHTMPRSQRWCSGPPAAGVGAAPHRHRKPSLWCPRRAPPAPRNCKPKNPRSTDKNASPTDKNAPPN